MLSLLLFALLFGFQQHDPKHSVVYRDSTQYCTFPIIQQMGSSVLLQFSWARERRHNVVSGENGGALLMLSTDEGRTWHKENLSKSENEGAGKLLAPDGSKHFIWPMLEEVAKGRQADTLKKEGIDVSRSGEKNLVSCRVIHIAVGRDGAVKQNTMTFPRIASLSGYGRGCTTRFGILLKPVYGLKVGEKKSSAMMLRSKDNGNTWSLVPVADDGEINYSEMEICQAADGDLVGMIRTDSTIPDPEAGFLMMVRSADDGATWSRPSKTEMWGYPADLIKLHDGVMLCSYGYRRPPYGIRASFSKDNGKTWDVKNEVILRDDLIPPSSDYGAYRTMDFGYPRCFERHDGSIVTVYYCTDAAGVTGIEQTVWTRDFRGPGQYARGRDAVPKQGCGIRPSNICGDTYPVRMTTAFLQSFIPCDTLIEAVAILFSNRHEMAKGNKHGIKVWIRKIDGRNWYTKVLSKSAVIPPDKISLGQWTLFRFPQPVRVESSDQYVLNIVNDDYYQGASPRLREDLGAQSVYFISTGARNGRDYTNGGMSPIDPNDIAFQIITPSFQLKEGK